MENTVCFCFRVLRLLCLLCMIPIGVFAQQITVKGVVKDSAGEAVIGASVVQKGTTNGIVTDFEGNFEISVPADAILSISFVGYKTCEIRVAGKTSFTITLEDDTELLDEVVVIGYGTARQSDVTGSISSMEAISCVKFLLPILRMLCRIVWLVWICRRLHHSQVQQHRYVFAVHVH